MTDQPDQTQPDQTKDEPTVPPQDQKAQPPRRKIQTQLSQIKKQVEGAKISAQNTYKQALNKATETVDNFDTWAVDRVNENLDKVAETVDRSRIEAQAKLQKSLKQTQSTIQQKAKNTSDRLKNVAQNVAQSALKKFKG
jgi:ElaB/YqjD/DUF883 family membrane-anchored ribosome-binding protein